MADALFLELGEKARLEEERVHLSAPASGTKPTIAAVAYTSRRARTHIAVAMRLRLQAKGVIRRRDKSGIVTLQRRHVGLFDKVHLGLLEPKVAMLLEEAQRSLMRVVRRHDDEWRPMHGCNVGCTRAPCDLGDSSRVALEERGPAQTLSGKLHLDAMEAEALTKAASDEDKGS
eukprot:scaffold88184_cov31-Tisochrysis_lutea.AAC.1